MEVTELRFVVLDDPILAAVGIGGLCILALGAAMIGPLHRSIVGRRLMLMGLALIGCAAIYALVAGWLTRPI